MKYYFGIDETGEFSSKSNSFVCGVLTSKSEDEFKEKYRLVLQEFFPDQQIGGERKDIIGNKQFHFSKLSEEQKDICKKELLPLAEKIFVSTGEPLLYANNQNYWQIAIVAIITQLFEQHKFCNGDIVRILIDQRARVVWGVLDDVPSADRSFKAVKGSKRSVEFIKYHSWLEEQFKNRFKKYEEALDIKIEIEFSSDVSSFYVNLADVICGLVRQDSRIETIKCSCESVLSDRNPNDIVEKSPIAALSIVFQEILNKRYLNVSLIKDTLKKNRQNDDFYKEVWGLFLNYLKYQMKQRYVSENFNNIYAVVDIFLNEFKLNYGKITGERVLEILVSFVEYVSHSGIIEPPFTEEFIEKLFRSDFDSYIIRKWEYWVDYHLRKAQVLFNAYNFKLAEEDFEKLWAKQDNIIKIFDFGENRDEQATAIIGTLAQSYAYNGDIEKAIEHFEISSEYAVETSAQSFSYLVTCYVSKQDIANARHCFEKQAGLSIEAFNYNEKNDVWSLLSYTKIRALELYVNGKTNLPELLPREGDNKSYPNPLTLKWLAVALFIENVDVSKQRADEYLRQGVEELLKEGNGFTLRTLAIPLLQVWGLVNSTNPYHAKYDRILRKLEEESSYFRHYIEQQAFLKSVKNNADIWQRAMVLPFNYS